MLSNFELLDTARKFDLNDEVGIIRFARQLLKDVDNRRHAAYSVVSLGKPMGNTSSDREDFGQFVSDVRSKGTRMLIRAQELPSFPQCKSEPHSSLLGLRAGFGWVRFTYFFFSFSSDHWRSRKSEQSTIDVKNRLCPVGGRRERFFFQTRELKQTKF